MRALVHKWIAHLHADAADAGCRASDILRELAFIGGAYIVIMFAMQVLAVVEGQS